MPAKASRAIEATKRRVKIITESTCPVGGSSVMQSDQPVDSAANKEKSRKPAW
jgi:hypothetical protein